MRLSPLTTAALLALHVLAACEEPAPLPDAGADGGPPDAGVFTLRTSAFGDGEAVPVPYQCGPPLVADSPGMNVTPELSWTSGPPSTASYAVVMRDRSAGDLVHWVMYDIPASAREVAEGVPVGYEPAFPAGAKQAEIQGSGYFGYFGSCSGGRGNTYEWTLHALGDVALPGASEGSSDTELAALVEDASIASASFTGIW